MSEIKNCSSLDEIRSEIDVLDTQIVKLIAARSKYVRQAAKFKVSVEKIKEDSRMEAIISHVRGLAISEEISPNMIGDVYDVMIDEMVETEIAEFQNRKQL
jgi:isochorismate pyruvate lyase